ncbi:hypothetical protein L7F22_028593 [Adiantum nelumboides]|nr:hypothetical protein [Adiantum nelumboides]
MRARPGARCDADSTFVRVDDDALLASREVARTSTEGSPRPTTMTNGACTSDDEVTRTTARRGQTERFHGRRRRGRPNQRRGQTERAPASTGEPRRRLGEVTSMASRGAVEATGCTDVDDTNGSSRSRATRAVECIGRGSSGTGTSTTRRQSVQRRGRRGSGLEASPKAVKCTAVDDTVNRRVPRPRQVHERRRRRGEQKGPGRGRIDVVSSRASR